MEQPQGKSYTGKLVTYRVGDLQTGDIGPWPEGEATTIANLNVYPGTPGDQDRVARRLVRECVTIALGRFPSSEDGMTPQELNHALTSCPSLEQHMGVLASGDSGGGSLQDALVCVAEVLGRMPLGPQDMNREERLKVFQECPLVIDNRDALMAMDQNIGHIQAAFPEFAALEQEFRKIEAEIHRLERENPREIQRELDRLDLQRREIERQLWDDLQMELDKMDRRRFDLERKFQEQMRNTDSRSHRQVEIKYRRELDGVDRERFELERRTQNQIQQELSNLERDNRDRERQLWDEQQENFSRLEHRRFELEAELERLRMEHDRQLIEQEDRERFARERRLEEERFRRQEELDRQRIEQERHRNEQGRQRWDQERSKRDLGQARASQPGSSPASSSLGDPGGPPTSPSIGLPTRGFFTNSASGSMGDVNKFMDPTTLAVFGILLTLVATSLSLVKGS